MKKYAVLMLMTLMFLSTCLAVDQPDSSKPVPPGQIKKMANLEEIQGYAQNTIVIQNFSFQPSILSVPTGTTVTWRNQDNVQHTVTSDTVGLFDSNTITPGNVFSFTFNNPGSYKYHCNIHPNMHGEVDVTGQAAQGASSERQIPPGQVKKLTNQEQNQSSVQGAENVLPGAQNLNQGTALAQNIQISPKGKKPSWSEKPASAQISINNATAQGPGSKSTEIQNINQNQATQVTTNVVTPPTTESQQPSTQNVISNQVLKFTQYYQETPQKPNEPLSAPVNFELAGHEPTMLYFGFTQKSIPYSQYQSYLQSSGLNALWIQGAASWTQYAAVPIGSSLKLIGAASPGGYGLLYEINPDGTTDKKSYYFYPYNQIGFYADSVGQHLLFFVIDGQPSNIVVLDVIAYQPPPPIYNYASITISSDWLRGYDVYIDGGYQATEGTTGEAPGEVTITVPGNQYHNIEIYGDGFSFSDYRYFSSGMDYTLSV